MAKNKVIIDFESVARVYKERQVQYMRVTIPVALAKQHKIQANEIYKLTIEVDE